jgi:hypothetical protein
MTKQVHDILASGDARIVDAPFHRENASKSAPRNQVESDRNFGLPTIFFGATVALYLGFIGLMSATFSADGLVIPMVVFAVIIVAGFGVPAIWIRLKGNESAPMTMGQFQNEGFMTHTGRLTSRDAAIQMLILPALVVLWGCAIVMIAAIVT